MSYSTGSLGDAIRAARVSAKLTQAALGQAAGYAKGAGVSISRIESGNMRPTSQSLLGIATALGTTVAQLETEATRRDPESGTAEVDERRTTKQRLQDLQRSVDERTQAVTRLADGFNESHDRARDEFFLPFVAVAGRLRDAPLPPSPAELLDDQELEGDLGAEFRAEVAASALAMSLAAAAGGATAGSLAGGAAAYATFAATAAFGTASTGVAISGLTGIAATNATLATIGGGTLAAGGAGMAGGALVLAGIVAAPAAIATIGGLIWMSRRNKQQQQQLSEQLTLAEQEITATQAGFEALVGALDRAAQVFDYIGTHAAHAEKRWAMRLDGEAIAWSELDSRASDAYTDFLTIAGCQLAVSGIDAGAFMSVRGRDLEALTASTREMLDHAQRTVTELV